MLGHGPDHTQLHSCLATHRGPRDARGTWAGNIWGTSEAHASLACPFGEDCLTTRHTPGTVLGCLIRLWAQDGSRSLAEPLSQQQQKENGQRLKQASTLPARLGAEGSPRQAGAGEGRGVRCGES